MELVDNPKEVLYRVIRPFDFLWDYEFNRPSPAAFKDKNGLSVSKLDNRIEKDIVEDFKKQFDIKNIIKISVQQCLEIKVYPVNKPSKDNPYHAEIWETPETKIIAADKRKKMAEQSIIVDNI